MGIKVQSREGENFLFSFAESVESKVENGRVNIPSKLGTGYVLGFLSGNHLRMIVRHYELNEDVLIHRQVNSLPSNMIQFSFKNILKEEGVYKKRLLPSVTISTQGLESEVTIPGNTSFNAINLAIQASYLKQLLDVDIDNTILKSIISNSQPLVFEQLVSAELQQIASEITTKSVLVPLQNFFYKLKAEELICYLLMELMERQDSNLQAVNITDIKALYAIRDKLISDLSEAPLLNELAALGGMSESKLKRLFKQVFGNSLYEYFQTIRMKEAAYLLKQEKRTVSEVGYALGFSNLSHFSRVFEEHVGMKPKKYSALKNGV